MAKEFISIDSLSAEEQTQVAAIGLAPQESANIGSVALQVGDVLTFKGELNDVIQQREYRGKHYTVFVDIAGREVSLKQLVRNRNGLTFPSDADKEARLRILAAQVLKGGLTLEVVDILSIEGMFDGVKTLQKQYIFG